MNNKKEKEDKKKCRGEKKERRRGVKESERNTGWMNFSALSGFENKTGPLGR